MEREVPIFEFKHIIQQSEFSIFIDLNTFSRITRRLSTWLGLQLLTWGLRKKIHNLYKLLLGPVRGLFQFCNCFFFSTKVPDYSKIIDIIYRQKTPRILTCGPGFKIISLIHSDMLHLSILLDDKNMNWNFDRFTVNIPIAQICVCYISHAINGAALNPR